MRMDSYRQKIRVDSRTLMLLPKKEVDARRVVPKAVIANEVRTYIFTYIHVLQSTRLEDVRRAVRENIYIQLTAYQWEPAQINLLTYLPMTLESSLLGNWTLKVMNAPLFQGLTPLVLSNVAKDMTEEEICMELVEGNKNYFGIAGVDLNSHSNKIEHTLKRSKDSKELLPTISVKIWVSHVLGDRMLLRGVLCLTYECKTIHMFHKEVPKCMRCRKTGHAAKFCRGSPSCRFCGEAHEYRDCPKKEEVTGLERKRAA